MTKIPDGVPSDTAASKLNALSEVPKGADSIVIRAGEKVRLWKASDMVLIETVGSAEEAGREGERIRVRLPKHPTEDGGPAKSLFGIIRGPGVVEIVE